MFNRVTFFMLAASILVIANQGTAQINWTEHDIDTNLDGAWGLDVADMDGDGDLDMVACSINSDDVAWYENDGFQNFTKYLITGNFNGGKCVKALDIDGDDDIDVVGAAQGTSYDGLINWWENDGNMGFTEHLVTSNFENAYWVDGGDIDLDGDIDITGVANWNNRISWWQNDGSQNFTELVVDAAFSYPYSVEIVDLDEDNDMDMVGGAAYDDISWFENNGSQSFTRHAVSNRDSCFGSSVSAVDMDGDGDLDVLGNDLWWHHVMWYENNGSESFTEHMIDYNFYGCWNLNAADMDHDNDIDVVGAAWRDSAITWWENDGSMNFARHDITLRFAKARAAIPVDLDDDGDMDIVGAAERSDRIAWWESDLGTTGMADDELNLPDKAMISSIYPNPFNPSATVSFVIPYETDVTLEIYDLLGRRIRTLYNANTEPGRHNITIDGSTLASNIYFVTMKTDRFFDSKR